MATATYVLEVDWSNSTYAGANDNVTADTYIIEAWRGRDYASQLTGRAIAGRLVAVLKNQNGKYSPSNSTGPLAGNLLPGRRVRLRVTSPSTQTLWTGYLARIAPEGSKDGQPVVRLEASGPLSRISGKRISPSAQSSAATGTIVGAILTAAGWSTAAAYRDIAAGQTTVKRWWADQIEALTALREIEETELGFLFEGPGGKLVYQDRHTRLKSPYTVSQATLSDASSATVRYHRIEQQDPLREIYNEVVSVVAPLQAASSQRVIWTLRGESPTIGTGQSRKFVAEYPGPEYNPSDGGYVDTWTTPAAGTDINVTGVSSSQIGVAAATAASKMDITLTNNGAATATVTLLRARGLPVLRQSPVRVVAQSTASQDNYGLRTYSLPGPWLPNTATAQDFCDHIISRYKDPVSTLRLEIRANRSTATMDQVLARDISDRVKVVSDSVRSKLSINDDYFIEAIGHRVMDGGLRHETVLDLSVASADAGYWAIGVSELGLTTKLAY